jgi:hypothetical protein
MSFAVGDMLGTPAMPSGVAQRSGSATQVPKHHARGTSHLFSE